MEAVLFHPPFDTPIEPKWGKMFFISLALHLAVFSTIFLVPETSTTRKISGTIYEVNLVELPKGKSNLTHSQTKKNAGKKLTAPAKTSSTKRIHWSKSTKAKPVVIAKRTVKTTTRKIKPPEDLSKKHVDQALEKLKKKVEEGESLLKEQAVPKMEAPVTAPGAGPATGRTEGITIHLYRMDVYETIKRNWSYPVALLGPDGNKGLVTIVELTVQNTGAILKTSLTQSSGNARYDESVLKAIKRSDPLPPFPEGYLKTHEEIVINFNLSELGNNH